MPLSAQKKQILINIIKTLLNKNIASIFSRPVDPEIDSCPDYFEVIKSPMDLGTVLKKLNEDSYENFSSFRDDVDLIWANAKQYNPKDSLVFLLADQLSRWFKQMIKGYSDDEKLDWITKYNQLIKDIDQFTNKLVEKKKQNSNTQSPKFAGKSPSGKTPSGKVPSSSSQALIDQLSNDDDSPISSPLPKPKSQPKRPPRPKVNQAEMNEIYSNILSLTERDKIIDVIDVIDQNEPQLGITEDSEIDLNQLTMTAKLALKEYFKNNQ